MPRPLSPRTSVEQLRKEAKRWLKALRAGDPAARDRMLAAWPEAPSPPNLRDVQRALALEHGFDGWRALKAAVADLHVGSPRERALRDLLRAAERGDVAALVATLDAYPDVINERGMLEGHTGQRTALHFGVQHIAVVEALLERGADPNIRDEGDNAFPLHFAAERGDLPVIKRLVEHGAQTVAGEIDDHGLDIIGWATVFPGIEIKPDVVEYLLAHGARHTLHSAVALGDLDAIRARARENPSALERPLDTVNRRRRALHLAVVKKQPDSLEALLDLGADPNAEDAGGLTPLDEAALAGEVEMAERLLRHRARLTLPAAVALGRMDEARKLLELDPGALRPGGRWGTLIVKAAAYAPGEVIDALVRLGASVDVWETPETSIDETKAFTALHAAAFHGNLEAVEALLTHGARTTVRDSRYGATPLGWARYARKDQVVERLLHAGLDIFDAIDFDRTERLREILEQDPEALHRPFGMYLPPGSVPSPWCPDPGVTPLAWATAQGKHRAVRVLSNRRAELVSAGHPSRSDDERVASFLRVACIEGTLGGSERRYLMHAASRMLRDHPELAHTNLYTAVVCGEVDEVRRRLSEDPSLANAPGGPRGWPPLLHLCTARLPGHPASAENAVEIARLLLDHGADPNAYYAGGDDSIHYTVLASVIGRGEEQAPTHPRARELAALLLDRGAEPYDVQVLYNAFGGHASHPLLADDDLVWLLELIYQASVKRGRDKDWRDPDWPMLGMGGYGGGAWYLLHSALTGNYLSIARWALEHGANPNPPHASDPRTPPGSLYEQARRSGLVEFAELLASYGAPRIEPDAEDQSNGEQRLFRAAEVNQVDVVRALLDAGVSPNVTNRSKARPLHVAAYTGSLDVARLLIERGAEIDPRDDMYGTTPIYWALFGQRWAMVDLLTPHSRDVWALVPAGKLDRLKEVIAAEPGLARARWEGGTPLFDLPDDERLAEEIVRLFLAHGADPAVERPDGATAEQLARGRGLTAAAELLRRGRR